MNVTARLNFHLDGSEVETTICPIPMGGQVGLRIGPPNRELTIFGTPEQVRDFLNAGLNHLGAYEDTLRERGFADAYADDEPVLVGF